MRETTKGNTMGKRIWAAFLAAVVLLTSLWVRVPDMTSFATDLPIDYMGPLPMDRFTFACIDSHELLGGKGGVYAGPDTGHPDIYKRVAPSSVLSPRDEAILFWAGLALFGSSGNGPDCVPVLEKANAAGAGISYSCGHPAFANDLKCLIHSDAYVAKYPWIMQCVNNASTLLTAMGLMGSGGGGGSTSGGKTIPAALNGATSATTAVDISGTKSIDVGDPEFLSTVKIEYSSDGATFGASVPSGWTSNVSGSTLTLDGTGTIYVRFNPAGTAYESTSSSGSFSSPEEVYDNCLELYVCTACGGSHSSNPSPTPPGDHQRFIQFHFGTIPLLYYVRVGEGGTGGEVSFTIYNHSEDFVTHYNVNLEKRDYETGEGLGGASFSLYERFDDRGNVDSDDGAEALCYEPSNNDGAGYRDSSDLMQSDWKKIASLTTNADGKASYTQEHKYHYQKTFCNGHPAPQFAEVPEPVIDPKNPGVPTNQAEIEEAQQANIELAQSWLDAVTACEDAASGSYAGIHFHFVMDGVDQSTIEGIAASGGEPGEPIDAGSTAEPSDDEMFSESGCEADRDATAEKFAAQKYSYTIKEVTAANGYTLHDVHTDDIPIEIVKTDSSENGANCVFGGGYSADVGEKNVGSGVKKLPAPKKAMSKSASKSVSKPKEETEMFTSDEPFASSEPSLLMKAKEAVEKATDSIAKVVDEIIDFDAEDGLVSSIEKAFGLIIAEAAEVDVIEIVTEEPDTEEENANVSEVSVVTFTPDEAEVEAAVAEEAKEPAKDIGLEALVIVDEEEETDGSSKPLISFDSVKEFFAETLGMPLLGAPGGSGADFDSAYAAAYSTPSKGDDYSFGSSGEVSHTWKVFDHRTEGEIHLNKQDMDLAAKSGTDYDAYADSNGDGTLEGAVYGLFAADDISHPDGHTGVVYAKNDLTAVATTDRDGNFSFMAYTVAPHQKFDYATGTIVSTGAGTGPSNLYGSISSDTTTIDDYPADGKYERVYPSNQRMNGNAWIGRPLMLGDYYVKELSRSEGYELSIEGKEDTLTNFGQDLDAGASASTAYAKVTTKLFYPGQIDGLHVYGTAPDYSSPDYDEIYFDVTTFGTKTRGAFDLLFSKLPAGSKLYRLDQTSGTKTVQVPDKDGSGNIVYEPVYELDGGGNRIPVIAENDHQYMKPDPSTGAPLTYTAYPNKIVKEIPVVTPKALDPTACSTAVSQAEDSVWTAAEVALINDDLYDSGSYTLAEKDAFIKTKVEAALRANGYGTPVNGSGFSGRENQATDEGDPAVVPAVYGASRLSLTISGVGSLKVSQVINEILTYYNDNGYWNYGGIHSMSYSSGTLSLVLYADRKGASKGFKSTVSGKEMILSPVEHAGADSDTTRKIWAYYTKDTKENVAGLSIFGYYKDYSVSGAKMDAALVTEAVDNAPGTSDMTLVSKEILQNVYYSTGDAAYEWDSAAHSLVPKYKISGYKVKTHPETIPYDGNVWTDLSRSIPTAEPHLVTVPVTKDDTADPKDYRFCLVVKTGSASELTRTLTAADIEKLPGTGWHIGNTMAISTYCVEVDQASVKAYADYASGVFGGASFVKAVTLEYPTQKFAGTSAGTLTKPLDVYERPIRESVKIGKDIILNADADGDGTPDSYRDNTYDYSEVVKQTNFRFKVYLKSNLERLYRNEAGEIVWMDRNGNEWEPVYGADGVTWKYKTAYGKKTVDFPEIGAKNTDGSTLFLNVQKIYTREEYNRILEIETDKVESGASFAEIEQYNYQKFFDALAVANGDKWDDNAPTYTSWHPIGNKANRSAFAVDNAKRSDRVRQFAIDWYLKDEVAKQVKGVENSKIGGKYTEDEAKRELSANNYGDAVYDEALNKAIVKAEDYLKPFFKYDLDKIYALSWDSELAGGKDTDLTTLSADLMNGDETYNYSAYLPYGEYIVVEQQPTYVGPSAAAFNDFVNKHYTIDRPKEVKVPSLYAGGISNATTDNYDPKYTFDISKNNEYWAGKDYLIRFGEEWNQNGTGTNSHVIRAHSYYGDFELYPYGLDVDYLAGSGKTVSDGTNAEKYAYIGFSIAQEEYDPLKDYYFVGHNGEYSASTGTISPITLLEGGNDSCTWAIEGMNTGKEPTANGTEHYDTAGLKKRVNYAFVSEDSGVAAKLLTKGTVTTEGNPTGLLVRTSVPTITGQLTAYDKEYAQMLVPYTVTRPTSLAAYDNADFEGFADLNEHNTFYAAKLRLEKLDAETHENILHDDAVFAIYKAQRDETTGDVKFYTVDTPITGSKEFVTAYCDRTTVMPVDPEDPSGEYQGTVKAGTPICAEADLVILGDRYGSRVSEFKAFSTAQDLQAKTESGNVSTDPATFVTQNTGYLELPQPLGAGTYVIVEKKTPAGYVRTAPVAVEIYSDKVTYYKEGKKDSRVMAAVYDEQTTNDLTVNKNKPQDRVDVAEVYVEDEPIKLTVEKVKESSVSSADTTADKTVTYRYSGRVEGFASDLAGREDLVLCYSDAGVYQGYAWKKGTLEYLANLKNIYDTDGDPLTNVSVRYDGGLFSGYGYVTLPLKTADDTNKYAVNATLTLYDALQLRRNDSYKFASEYAFTFIDGSGKKHGLRIERNSVTGRVERMYVEKGYAGVKTVFKKETDASGTELTADYVTGYDKTGKPIVTTGNIWNAVTVERENTDILFYDLDALELTVKKDLGGGEKLYGYDKEHDLVDVSLLSSDALHFGKSDNEVSIYAFKGSVPTFELVGGDLTKAKYNAANKSIEADDDTIVYHLDTDGNRDAMVNPHTGMAYVIELCDDDHGGTYEKYMVWPVEIYKDSFGNVIARDKITTSRVATIGENVTAEKDPLTSVPRANDPNGDAVSGTAATYQHDETGSVTGTWTSGIVSGVKSHTRTSDRTTKDNSLNLNGQTLLTDNNGSFVKQYSPVYDRNGNILYYQRSNDTYDKGSNLYDRDEDFVRYDPSDGLWEYSDNAYRQNTKAELFDTDGKTEDPITKKLYHRYGEGYVLQNTWVSSDETPNDPFRTLQTDGQADILKRVPEGIYIMEEIYAPEGYTKAFPAPVTVKETTDHQSVKMVDRTTKLEIAKVDGQEKIKIDILDMTNGGTKIGSAEEGIAAYSYGLVPGAELALYPAKKVYTADYVHYPKGYYLQKTSSTPVSCKSTAWTVSTPVMETCQWTTGTAPIYLEGLPQGCYILEEISVPAGFVKAAPMEVEIGTSMEVQEYVVNDDHTKLEVEKYYIDAHDGTKKQLSGAKFELHKAKTDAYGNVIPDADGNPTYEPAVLTEWTTMTDSEWIGFRNAFNSQYKANGTSIASVTWIADGVTHTAAVTSIEQIDQTITGGPATKFPEKAVVRMTDELGRKYKVAVYEQVKEGSGVDFTYDYEFDVKEIPAMGTYAVSYATAYGTRRFDYLDPSVKYVAVETAAPAGFIIAKPTLLQITETADIQRYGIEDLETQMVISKVLSGETKEAAGITLSLYEGTTLIKDAAHLVETWQTASDGTYTLEDQLHGRIPAGYAMGDLRPHAITKLPAGTYWLVEDDALPYYTAIAPLKIEYTDLSEIKFVRAENEVVKGKLTVNKKDAGGAGLSGATMLVQRYKKDNYQTPDWESTYVMTSPTLVVSDLPVGELSAGGKVIPYRYRVCEILPPAGYQIDNRSINFSFKEDDHGVPYAHGEYAEYSMEFVDRKTEFKLSKKSLGSAGGDETDDAFVDGAVLKVHPLLSVDADGNPVYEASDVLATITTDKSIHEYALTGLTAGKSYVIDETSLPAGLTRMDPTMFAISADGRKITFLGTALDALTFHTIKPADYAPGTINRDTDSIQSVTMKGSYITAVTYAVKDEHGTVIETFPGGYDHDIEVSTGYTNGKSYSIVETVAYSNGATAVTDSQSRIFDFDETGKFTFHTRSVDSVSLALRYTDGDLIDELTVTPSDFEKLIVNPVAPENPAYEMRQTGTVSGDPIDRNYAVINTVTVVNPDHRKSDAAVTVAHTGLTVIDPGEGTVSGSKITFTAADIPAGGSRTFTYKTQATSNFAKADISAEIGGKVLAGTKTVPCVLPNTLTVFFEMTGSGKEIFADEAAEVTVRLFDHASGDELAGTYSYVSPMVTGTMRSGDTFALTGNDYIRIDTGAYHDVDYVVARFEDGRPFAERRLTGRFTNVTGGSAVLTQNFKDTSERTIFVKGGTYDLYETVKFTDGETQLTSRRRVTLGDGASVEQIGVFDSQTRVVIEKLTPEDMPLSGCELELYDGAGILLDSWITDGSARVLDGVLLPGATYRLHEKTAKDGYALSSDILFTVNDDGAPERVVMIDKKEPEPDPPAEPDPPVLPDPPVTPDPPVRPTPSDPVPAEDDIPGFIPAEESPKTVGRITATYVKTMYGTGGGYYDHTGKWHPFLWPFGRFGDEFPWEVLMAVFFGSLLLLIFILLKNKKNRATILTAFVLMILFSAVAFAAPVTEYRAGGTYISPPFTGDGKDCYPAPVREIDGVLMERISCEMIDIETEERTESQTVPYEYYGLEAGTAVPGVQEIEFTDNNTGNVFTAILPLISAETADRYWDNSFSFSVHVEHADADSFLLGEKEVPKETPLINCAPDLLEMLELDPDSYRITAIEWSNDPYEDNEGAICRDARAIGEKRLRDVTAVYGGMVTYPAVSAKAWECEYRETVPQRPEEMTPAEPETENSELPTPVEEPGPDGLRGIIRAICEAVKQAVGKVVRIIKEHPQESVLCLVVSAAFIVFLLLTGAKQKCLFQPKVQCPYRKRTTETCNTCLYRYQQPQPKKGLFRPKKDKENKKNQQDLQKR